MNEMNIYNFSEILKQASDYMKNLHVRIQHVQSEIEKAEKENTDIGHYIEWNDLNASNGFKIYKQQQDCLRRRRKLKDELDYLESIDKQSKNAFRHQNGLELIVNSIEKTKNLHENRRYTPRVRKDLFE